MTVAKPVFDNYEIHGCRRIDVDYSGVPDPSGSSVETCEDSEAQFWTLYGHINGQGVEAIGDFSSRKAAEEVYYRITGQPFSNSYEADDKLRLMHAAPKLRDALWAAFPFVAQWSDWVYACEDYGEKSDAIDRQYARMLEAYTEATGCQREEILARIAIDQIMQADWFQIDEIDERVVRAEYDTVPDGFDPVVGDAWSHLQKKEQEYALRMKDNVNWSGFSRDQIDRVIRNVIDGQPKEQWFLGVGNARSRETEQPPTSGERDDTAVPATSDTTGLVPSSTKPRLASPSEITRDKQPYRPEPGHDNGRG
jgi:hypothetical protein